MTVIASTSSRRKDRQRSLEFGKSLPHPSTPLLWRVRSIFAPGKNFAVAFRVVYFDSELISASQAGIQFPAVD